jgi:hypothetical protein
VGCFEAIEEINYTDTDKGEYALTLNASRSKERLKTLSKLDSFMGINLPKNGDISNELYTVAEILKKTDGIRSVYYKTDFDTYIFTLSFKFDSTQALNEALNNIFIGKSKKSQDSDLKVFEMKENIFKRLASFSDTVPKLNKKQNELLKLINGSTLTSIYRFTKPIKKISHADAKLSKNKLAVMLKQDINQIIKEPSKINNQIQF